MRWVLLGAVVVACLGYLIYSATGASAEYYVTMAQMRQHPPQGEVRVLGTVQGGIRTFDAGRGIEFTAAQGKDQLQVSYVGTMPEIFKPGVQVVVDGRPGANGVFVARSLQTKCPSKFTAATPAAG
ncbi:MAG TPA: cytochrome c maturation protein CcmE [Candidatus Nitrosotalea sp.]|nr:cytochrome c maturation protein CcmE [Candidatus Nitrosotalea sp.]